MLLVVDANVLIDYASTDPTVLALVVAHLGPVHVPRDVLAEVNQLDEAECARLGLRLVDGTIDQILEAGAGGGSLSFQDRVCLILARDHGWTCVSNDKPLRASCAAEGVAVMWGLQLMLALVEAGALGPDDAIEVAEDIGAVNRWISAQVIAEFRRRLGR